MSDAPTTPAGGALVVGAGSGIGRAVAEHFASRGIRTVAADLNPDATKELASRHDGIVTVGDAGWDATDPQACDRLVKESVEAIGSLDRVVSTVGWTAITRFLEESPDYWRRIVDVNLMSAIYLSAAAGRVMKDSGGGSIVLRAADQKLRIQFGDHDREDALALAYYFHATIDPAVQTG
ncbi:MAG: SDR family NAD(P)-dependent oxidoreductase, partial [Aeromicrobium sp.]